MKTNEELEKELAALKEKVSELERRPATVTIHNHPPVYPAWGWNPYPYYPYPAAIPYNRPIWATSGYIHNVGSSLQGNTLNSAVGQAMFSESRTNGLDQFQA